MKASEIRINNWLLNSKGEFIQVQSITLQNGANKFQINNLPAKEFSPIPLTPDILHLCGFDEKISTYNIIYTLEPFRLEHNHEGEGFILLNSERITSVALIVNVIITIANRRTNKSQIIR